MNPLVLGLLGLGALGLLASSGGGAPAPSATPAPVPSSWGSQGGGASGPPALTHANIDAAVQVAMAHETDPNELERFSAALTTYGFVPEANELAARALALRQPHPQPTLDLSGLPYVSPAELATMPTAVAPAPSGTTESTFTLGGEGSVSSDPTWVQTWVNRYLGTNLHEGDAPTPTQVEKATEKALKVEKNLPNLMQFASALGDDPSSGYWVQSDYLVQRAAELVTAKGDKPVTINKTASAMLAPFVKKYAAAPQVTNASLRTAIASALLTETSGPALLPFGAAAIVTFPAGGQALMIRANMLFAGGLPVPKNLSSHPVA